jgi:RimJ/RimL family protein N-acetyltransferase
MTLDSRKYGVTVVKLEDPLFQGKLICLAPIDHEVDPPIEARWTHDVEFMRQLQPDPVRPLSPAMVKKKYEQIHKTDGDKKLIYFTIRLLPDDRLIGFARLYQIEWNNGVAAIQLGIGDPEWRGRGCGTEALQLLLRYAFGEMNLYRLSAIIVVYNQAAIHLFEKAGFTQEVCRRQAIQRDGRRWDLLHYGILHPEWERVSA